MAPSLLITRIGELVTNAPDGGGPGGFAAISDAALVISGDRIAWTGPAARAPAADDYLDAAGRAVLPGFVDSHAHLVFAGERSAEFAARMAGRPYQAGGIRTTVAATRAATDAELRAGLHRLAGEMLRQGTTTFECKSGYGLTTNDEARCAALAAELTDEVTYLGAHVVPVEFAADPAGYLDLVCGPMLAACAAHCRWADVFCERGAFGEDEARAVLTAGLARGLLPRVHANQLGPGPGIRLAVELGAASADHCTFVTDADVSALASSRTVATLLPGAEFSTRQPYPDARRLLQRRRDGRPGDRLQSRHVLHDVDAVLRCSRGTRHAHDNGGSGLVGNGGRRPRAAPRRRRLPGARRARRPGHPGRPVTRAPRVPAGRPVGPRGLSVRPPPAGRTGHNGRPNPLSQAGVAGIGRLGTSGCAQTSTVFEVRCSWRPRRGYSTG